MGFNNDVAYNIKGEEKRVTVVDLDKEYGIKGYGKPEIDILSVKEQLEKYRQDCYERIYSLEPYLGSRDYSQYILAGNSLEWNKDSIEAQTTTFIGTMAAHLERIKDSGLNPLNNL